MQRRAENSVINPRLFSTSKAADEKDLRGRIRDVSDVTLQEWASDPDCLEMEICSEILSERLAERPQRKADDEAALAAKRTRLESRPFDARTEVSADARHIAGRIIMHLWMLFVLLPVAIALLWVILE